MELDSAALRRLQSIQKRILDTTPELRDAKRPRRGLDASRDSRPTTGNSANKRKGREQISKATDLEGKIQEYKKLIEKERDIIEQMERDMDAREKRYERREKEYRKTLAEYEAELRARANYAQLPLNEQMDRQSTKIDGLYGEVSYNINNIQKKTTQILSEQDNDIRRQFDTRMRDINKELEQEKKRKLEGVGNFAEKESQLTRELELIKASMDLIESKNHMLKKHNIALKQEFRAQEGDREVMVQRIVGLKRENAQLAEELAKYKEISKSMMAGSQMVEESVNPSRLPSAGPMDENKVIRFEGIISRIKRMLEIERKNLRSIRTSYARELQNKTELEAILRQCVDEVKASVEELGPQERERIVELMLSQERVLTLLYERTFPSRGVTRENINEQLQCIKTINDFK